LGIEWCVAGAVAANAYRDPRATTDLDLIVHIPAADFARVRETIEHDGWQVVRLSPSTAYPDIVRLRHERFFPTDLLLTRHMFLRVSTQSRADGSVLKHFQIAESTWNRARQRSETRIIYNCGRAEDPVTVEKLRGLARSIIRRCSPEEIAAGSPAWRLIDAWPYGPTYVLEKSWERLGVVPVLKKAQKGRRFGFSIERALFAMIANRCCAPSSKLYCWGSSGCPRT
jgi:hypothetical protein